MREGLFRRPRNSLAAVPRAPVLGVKSGKELRMDAGPKTVFSLILRARGGAWPRQPNRDRQMGRRDSKTTDLRALLSKALQSGRFPQALDLYELIERRKPDEPRWAHRKGDLLHRMGRDAEAVVAYERAVHLYSAMGFDARAAATAKLLMGIDPSKGAVLDWAASQAARRFERHSRNSFQLNY